MLSFLVAVNTFLSYEKLFPRSRNSVILQKSSEIDPRTCPFHTQRNERSTVAITFVPYTMEWAFHRYIPDELLFRIVLSLEKLGKIARRYVPYS